VQEIECYLVDENGFIVASKTPEQVSCSTDGLLFQTKTKRRFNCAV